MKRDDERAPTQGSASGSLAAGHPLAGRLRALREAAGLTQEELANTAGISVATVSALERGVHHSPQSHTARQLAAALGLSDEESRRFLAEARTGRPSRRVQPLVSGPLPVARGDLLGREAELAAAEDLLARARWLTITGPPGVGKTRLALEIVLRWRDRGTTQIIAWVPLAETADAADVLPAVARAFGLPAQPEAPPAAAVAAALAGRSALLVLDGIEHLPGAWPGTNALHDASPGLRIVATGRSRLRIPAERALTLGPLPPPSQPTGAGAGADSGSGSHASALSDPANPAVALYLAASHASGQRRDVSLPDVAHLVSRLDGLPLAIELAAAQADTLPPAALAGLLEHGGLEVLSLGPDGGGPVRRMDAAIARSVDALPEPVRRLFAMLGPFRGGFTTEALAGFAGLLGEPGLVSGLPALAAAHLAWPGAEKGRFVLLEPFRLHALATLRRAGEESAARRAHAGWYTSHALRLAAETAGQRPVPALDAIEADLANIREAIAAASEAGRHETALRTAADLRRFWETRARIGEGRATIGAALAAAVAAGASPPALADASFTSGYLAALQCDFAAGSSETGRLRRIAGAADGAEARRVGALAAVLASCLAGDLPETGPDAIAALRHGLALAEDDRDGFANWALTLRLGVELLQQGDPAAAVPLLRDALVRARLRGAALDQPTALAQLGLAETALGELAAGREHLREAIALGNRLGVAAAALLGSLGLARAIVLAGDAPAYPEALRLLDEAEGIRARAGYEYGAFWDEQTAECRRIAAAGLAAGPRT